MTIIYQETRIEKLWLHTHTESEEGGEGGNRGERKKNITGK